MEIRSNHYYLHFLRFFLTQFYFPFFQFNKLLVISTVDMMNASERISDSSLKYLKAATCKNERRDPFKVNISTTVTYLWQRHRLFKAWNKLLNRCKAIVRQAALLLWTMRITPIYAPDETLILRGWAICYGVEAGCCATICNKQKLGTSGYCSLTIEFIY